jgi:ABC-type branched-subunit amino acid transport system substrate-binding protein
MKRVVRALAPLASVAALAVVTASGCSGKAAASGGGPDATTGTITIGVIDSLTGGLSGLGVGLNQVIGVAARQINRVGLAGGRQVVFDVRDDTSDPNQSVVAAQALLAEGVAGIIGPISSQEVFQVQSLTYDAQIVEISASATSTELDGEPPPIYFFRTAPPDNLQASAVVKYMRDGIATGDGGAPTEAGAMDAGGDAGAGAPIGGTCQHAFIVNGNDAYGTKLGDAVVDDFTTGIVGRQPVPTQLQGDYSSVLAQIVAANPDCVILIVYSDVGAEFMRELEATTTWKGTVCGTDGEYDANFIPDGQSNPADPTSANSTAGFSGTAPDTAPNTPEYETFRAIWQESYPGTEPPIYGANQYDAAILLALAVQKSWKDGTSVRDGLVAVAGHTPGGGAEGGAGTEDAAGAATPTVYGPGQLVDALDAISRGESVDYNGASGDCNFDDRGDVKTGYIVWQVVAQHDKTYAFETIAEIKAADL